MEAETGANERPALIRALGTAGVALIVLNSMIGAGIFALPASVAAGAGAFSPWLFLIVGMLFLTVVLSFAELASYFKTSGGPVLYASAAFGPFAGFASGWLLYISRLSAFAANLTAMALYLAAIWPAVGTPAGRALFIIAVCGLLTVLNYVGVRDGIRTLAVFTVLKLVPVMILVLVGLKEVTGDTLLPSGLPAIDDLGGLTLLIIYAFIGFEAATIVSGETRNPRRTMPRALVTTVIGISVLYFLIMLVYITVLPGGGNEGATLADVGTALFGSAGGLLIAIAAVFSIGGNLAANMLSVPRLSFALSEQGLLPAWLGRVHPRFNTPGNSVLMLGALTLFLALTGTFALLAGASSLARLFCYVLSIAGLPKIRRQALQPDAGAAFRLPFGFLIPTAALILCLGIAASSPVATWGLATAQLAVGLLLFLLARRLKRVTR